MYTKLNWPGFYNSYINTIPKHPYNYMVVIAILLKYLYSYNGYKFIYLYTYIIS